jgi:purine-binding chemotaxis protein CheW
MDEKPLSFEDIELFPTSLGLAEESIETKPRRDLLVVRAATHLLGVFADEADIVSRPVTPAPLPNSPKTILGIVNLRGRMRTLIDPSLLFDNEAGEHSKSSYNYIVALRGDEQLALAVDNVERIVEIEEEFIERPGNTSKIVRGLIQSTDQIIVLLELSELFESAYNYKTPIKMPI